VRPQSVALQMACRRSTLLCSVSQLARRSDQSIAVRSCRLGLAVQPSAEARPEAA